MCELLKYKTFSIAEHSRIEPEDRFVLIEAREFQHDPEIFRSKNKRACIDYIYKIKINKKYYTIKCDTMVLCSFTEPVIDFVCLS